MVWQGIIFTIFLVAFAVIDIRSRMVPNRLLLIATVATLGILGFSSMSLLAWGLVGGLVGFVFYGFLYLFAPLGKVGAGDVKLAGLVGLMTGIPLVFLALPLGIILGGIASGIVVALRRVKVTGSIPYAPFLCSGGIISLWAGDWLINRYLGLF